MSVAKITIIGEDRASAAIRKVADSSDHATKRFGSLKTAGAAGLAGLATAAVAFGKSSVDAFQSVGKQTLLLQRYVGGTAEDASRLRFAAQESGLGADDLAKGLGKLSKAVVGATDKTKAITTHVQVATGAWHKQTTIIKDAAGHFQKIEKMVPVMKMESLSKVISVTNPLVEKLGFKVRDAHGQLLPMSQLLPKIADKFKEMKAGPEKTALALQLFGKAGMGMLPFLNKGSEGIRELTKESDKLGNTMSGKDLQAIKDNVKAKREWHATIQGVQIQLGRHLFPALTAIGKALVSVTQFVERNSAVIKPLVALVGGLTVGIWGINLATKAWGAATKAWSVIAKVATGVQWLFNAAMDANPIALVVIALAAMAAGLIYAYKHSDAFRKIVQATFGWIKAHWPLLVAILTGPIGIAVLLIVKHWTTIRNAVSSVLSWIKGHWPLILAILTGPIGLAVLYISNHFTQIVGFVKGLPAKIKRAAVGMWDGIKAPFVAVYNFIRGIFDKILSTINTVKHSVSSIGDAAGGLVSGAGHLLGFAAGGSPPIGRVSLVGENGPELFVPRSAGTIIPNHALGGGDTYHVYASSTAQGKDIVTALRRYKQETGGRDLGIA